MIFPRLELRRRLSTLAVRIGADRAVLRARSATFTPWLTVLTWHRISERDLHGAEKPSFDPCVIDADAGAFEEQIAFVSRHFSLIGIDDVRAWAGGASLPKNPLLATFDDGYRECHDVVLPILKRHGARATFFIATSYVTERRLFWWDQLAYLLLRSPRARIEISYPHRIVFDIAANRGAAIRAAQRVVKDTAALDLPRYLDGVAEASGTSFGEALEHELADRLIMSWDQVRALRAAGMDVQSHTRTHRVLQTLSPQQLRDELAGSRADLEQELGEPVRTLAYPTGRPIDSRSSIARAVREAGFDVGFSNSGGVNALWSRDAALHVRRQPIDSGTTLDRFKALLALPFLG